MNYALVIDNVATFLPVGKVIRMPDGTQHPYQVISIWTEAELRAAGIYPVTFPEPPAGKRLVRWTGVEYDSGADVVNAIPEWEDIPPGPTDEEIADEAIEVAFARKDAVRAFAKALFIVVNDVRALEGKQPITAEQFKTFLKQQVTANGS